MYGFNSFLMLLGRFALAAIFLLSGINKFMDYDNVAAYMASKELQYVPFLLISAAILEILGALALIIGFKTRWAALLLFLFLIPTTLIFHNFWQLEGTEAFLQRLFFLKNIAIMGGLLFVVANGSGAFAADRCCKE